MSDSVGPHRWQPTRLPHPWDSPGKNTGVGCHFLLQCMKVKSEIEVAQSCPTLSNPMDCSPTGSSVHGIFQARVLEWGAIALHYLFPNVNSSGRNQKDHATNSKFIYILCRFWGPHCDVWSKLLFKNEAFTPPKPENATSRWPLCSTLLGNFLGQRKCPLKRQHFLPGKPIIVAHQCWEINDWSHLLQLRIFLKSHLGLSADQAVSWGLWWDFTKVQLFPVQSSPLYRCWYQDYCLSNELHANIYLSVCFLSILLEWMVNI